MKYQSSITKLVYDIESSGKRIICPECSESRGKKNNKDLQYYNKDLTFYCHHCTATFFEYSVHEKKDYIVPEWTNTTELSDKALKWFESRSIGQGAIKEMNICSRLEYMPQLEKKVDTICFPMYVGDVVKNIKYRAPKKSFKLHSGSELVWYNYNALIDADEIIIVEGELDLLSWIHQGFKNVISVPNGANKNLEYLNTSIDLFDNIKKIYIATDQDTKGIELRDELIRRLGAEKCYIVNFKQYKDSNDYLIKEGGLEFNELLNNAKPIPVKGAIRIESFYNKIEELYEHGIPCGAKVGNSECDDYITWELGRLCMVTGVPGSGKSEWVDYITTRLNLLYGWKTAYFSPENFPHEYHYAKIHEKFSGATFKKETDNTNFLSTYEHIKDNFYYILDEDDMSLNRILEITKSYIKSNGIKMLVIDPYNILDHSAPTNMSETQYISTFLDKLLKFTRFNNILTFLVAHPKKMQKGDVPTLYDISGSAHFYNKTDYGVTIDRVLDEVGAMTNEVNVYYRKIKFKHLGKQGVGTLKYNGRNGRYEIGTVDQWDNLNWLDKTDNNIKVVKYPTVETNNDLQPSEDFFNQEDAPF